MRVCAVIDYDHKIFSCVMHLKMQLLCCYLWRSMQSRLEIAAKLQHLVASWGTEALWFQCSHYMQIDAFILLVSGFCSDV